MMHSLPVKVLLEGVSLLSTSLTSPSWYLDLKLKDVRYQQSCHLRKQLVYVPIPVFVFHDEYLCYQILASLSLLKSISALVRIAANGFGRF